MPITNSIHNGFLLPGGQFMALVDDGAHQVRVTLGNPTQGEEGGPGVVLGQQREDAVDVALDPAFTPIPITSTDVGRHRRDLKIVFDVDGQRVGEFRGQHGGYFAVGA